MAHLQGGRDGCKTADEKVGGKSSCFSCPFPDCILVDMPGHNAKRVETKKLRDEAIRAELAAGMTAEEAASKYNLRQGSIERIGHEALIL